MRAQDVATAETTTQETQAETAMEKWRKDVMGLWLRRPNEKGPEAFAALISLCNAFTNTACTVTASKDPETDRWMDEAGIDPVLIELVYSADRLLEVIETLLAGKPVREGQARA